MFEDSVLIHRPGGTGHVELADLFRALQLDAFTWQTCLRQIAIIDETDLEIVRAHLKANDEIHHGDAGYRFVLQVICGLHSPLVGETEVYGQFKNAVANHAMAESPFSLGLKRFFKFLFEDAKRVRQDHLKDLGSQSYGSVLRREVKGYKRIHILGAGQFVKDLLPWIRKDGNEILVYARDVEKARASLPDNVQVVSIHDAERLCEADALLVAAPVTAAWLQAWIPSKARLKFIADLRANSHEDRIESCARILDLAQVFERISSNQTLLTERKRAALASIEAAARVRSYHVEYRPFGWEDVCA